MLIRDIVFQVFVTLRDTVKVTKMFMNIILKNIVRFHEIKEVWKLKMDFTLKRTRVGQKSVQF